MGYPVPENASKVTVQGRTFAAASFQWANPMGSFYKVGVFEKQPDGSWNEAFPIGLYTNPGDLIADVKAKGGIVKFIEFVIAKINAFFAQLFGNSTAPVLPTNEPTTDEEALAYISSHLASKVFALVAGVPVLA